MQVDRFFIANQYKMLRHVSDAEELKALYSKRSKDWPVAWDTETTGLVRGVPNVLYDPDAKTVISEQLVPAVFGLSMAFVVDSEYVTDGWNGLCLVWSRIGTDLFDTMKKLVADKQEKVWHNFKYDSWVCQESGIHVGGVQNCTVIQARSFWNRRRSVGLKKLTEFLCPGLSQWDSEIDAEMKRLKAKWTRAYNNGEYEWYEGVPYCNYSFVPEELMSQYASLDSFMCLMLWLRLQSECAFR
ncbi:MAG: hypothetical protein GY941_21475 [Planctomycetes bacterium]|nr:hypothetical protein [Planctomycetota bacterium]